MPKKVLFVSVLDSFMLQFLLPYLKMFHEKGYEVHVATSEKGKIPYCSKKHIFPVTRSPFNLKNIEATKELKRIIDKEKFDIIHCHTPMGGVTTRLASKKARKNGTRIIYTAHGFHFFKGAPFYYWLLFYPIEKYLSKFTDTLITINKDDYNIAKKRFKKCQDIQYVPGVGLDTDKFKHKLTPAEKNNLRQSLGLTNEDFVLIFPAEISNNKQQKAFIKATEKLLKKHSDIHVLLAGIDRTSGKTSNYAMRLGVASQIHFLGYRKDIPELFQIANLSFSSSKREGLPVNIMEAMHSGLPCVVTDCRGNRDLIKDDLGGKIIPSNNLKLFADAIDYFCKHKEESKKAGQFNYKESEKYSLTNIKKKYEDIYFKKKTILHLLASNRYSGAENVACTIIDNLKNDYNFIYCSPDGPITETLKERDITYYPLKKLNKKTLKNAIRTINPDIIHAHDLTASFLASLCKKNQKLIFHIHKNDPKMRKLSPKSVLFSYAQKKADKIIWVSQNALDKYYFKNYYKDKNIVVPNVIDSKRIIRLSKEYKSEPFDLIFLGRLSHEKNPLEFIKIVSSLKKLLPNIKVAIVGDGELKNKVEQAISANHLRNNVKLFGHISNPYPILVNSKILCMTSIYEGLPMCSLEANVFCTPIIANSNCHIPHNLKCKTIIEDNYDKTIAKIVNLLTSYKKQAQTPQHDNKAENDYYRQIDILYNNIPGWTKTA